VTRQRLNLVLVARAHSDSTRVGWARAGAGLFVACCVSVSLVGLLTTIVVIVLLAAVAARIRRARRARQTAEVHGSVVDLCRAIAAELRAGHPSGQAFAAAVHAAPSGLDLLLRPAVTVAQRGDIGDLADAVARVAANPGCAGLRRLAACWRVAAASGAALAPAIDRVADALQDEIDVTRDVTSTLAGPRATVHLLAGLPVLGLLLGTAIGARPLDFLFGSGPGVGCLLAAASLDAAGVAWARRIAHRATRFG
jgi:tight adherence protein B